MLEDQRGPAIRALDGLAEPRRYWHGHDEQGGVWLFETVEETGEQWAVKQIEIGPDRRTHKYWWRHLQDAHGFLTDQAVELWEFGMTEITAEAFQQVWDATDCACGDSGPDMVQ
ncbi:hypothetical protein [Spongiactinospora sp. TRM90649]|uniref:hypothetical protein n=1 Tax=Spongiactinospora sp. TRM90649 TaxID=3031114 RepID=UPI0023F969EF|nr:hypothetical protein [Spongiactinospora sp. TRM90649]MDF5759148.1 hypothetical protein [Spongiactinospora sp. TRM90649]